MTGMSHRLVNHKVLRFLSVLLFVAPMLDLQWAQVLKWPKRSRTLSFSVRPKLILAPN
jgi:hypothetical protein